MASAEAVEESELPTYAASFKAEVEMGGAHSSENRWTLGFQGVGMATPHRLIGTGRHVAARVLYVPRAC
ncbi:jg8969 [Pararge aegeria aegeria]|uniref:Jg8969 protein n=1 Tax=Pararge aegeria aegeria TaxID=348720 RepID=A0A8S4QKJ0_9NEOP|nr:jg8969 [Pararge aegeria aegeria]